MISVFDASPIHYLILIEEVDIAPQLLGEILLPQAVVGELSHPGAPGSVRQWIANPPAWLQVHSVKPQKVSASLQRLDEGEREAILLAQDLEANWLVVDEKAARRVARALGLRVTGLIGLLAKAAEQHLIDLPAAIHRLGQTNFHVAPNLLKQLLDSHRAL